MEAGYAKADSANLPHIDAVMVASFFASNSDFNAAEFRNIKTTASSRQSYGDDAIGYVQLQRDSNVCTLKCKVCPEHRVWSKSYAATMTVDEREGKVVSVQCHDCAGSQGGCKHAVAFLMWVHRRSEEPSSTSVECYWKKSTLAQVGTTLKCITTKELSKAVPTRSQNTSGNLLFTEFVKEAATRNINSCLILKHHPNFQVPDLQKLSLHYLINKYNDRDCNTFLDKILHVFTQANIDKLEEDTRGQHESNLWHEMRYGRITGSIAYSVSRCKTVDGTLVATIMGARTPETKAMKRGRALEEEVKKCVSKQLGKKIEQCGLIISQQYPYIAATPDGICNKTIIIEIKCPSTEKTFKNYIKEDNTISERCMSQIQLQMFVSNLKKCYFCVANWNFENNGVVHTLVIDYDQAYVNNTIQDLTSFWINNIYPLLYESTK